MTNADAPACPVLIHTDGACLGNPGPGGYGAILHFNGVEKEFSGGFKLTTNNRMEILAVIVALEAVITSYSIHYTKLYERKTARNKASAYTETIRTPLIAALDLILEREIDERQHAVRAHAHVV